MILLDDEIDPDVNSCRMLITPCNYYLPNEIADRTEESQFAGNLSLIHINARSMVNKLVYIELLLKTIKNDFDILAVSETWENNLNTHLINIPGYTKVSSMRSDGIKGGGTALFI